MNTSHNNPGQPPSDRIIPINLPPGSDSPNINNTVIGGETRLEANGSGIHGQLHVVHSDNINGGDTNDRNADASDSLHGAHNERTPQTHNNHTNSTAVHFGNGAENLTITGGRFDCTGTSPQSYYGTGFPVFQQPRRRKANQNNKTPSPNPNTSGQRSGFFKDAKNAKIAPGVKGPRTENGLTTLTTMNGATEEVDTHIVNRVGYGVTPDISRTVILFLGDEIEDKILFMHSSGSARLTSVAHSSIFITVSNINPSYHPSGRCSPHIWANSNSVGAPQGPVRGGGSRMLLDLEWESKFYQSAKPAVLPPLCRNNREHQAADWKNHKVSCKSHKAYNQYVSQTVRPSSEMAPSGLTVKEEILYQEDDFLRLHMWNLCIAMECCIHEVPYMFNVKKRFMRIGLQYLSNRDGNPAKMFTLRYVASDDLQYRADIEENFAVMQKVYENYVGLPGYRGLLRCTFELSGLPNSTFPIPFFEDDPLRDGPVVTGWYERLKCMMDTGIVHRLLDDVWKPGVMVKKGKKWIFQERSREALFAEFGVRMLY
ncbi:hypothetical protein M413DRAFT_8804 [Hebeloma cylindrosporum]|uniref:Uncharacterized protein n=1 Tax=Hebeloma cylindrosporum TaxID=76867 RepID=A0A0C3CPH9_HEBCY|nr:hypothetical protein M413DRAFT_8804 [Hebeloma cylindrosporum h7]